MHFAFFLAVLLILAVVALVYYRFVFKPKVTVQECLTNLETTAKTDFAGFEAGVKTDVAKVETEAKIPVQAVETLGVKVEAETVKVVDAAVDEVQKVV